MNQAIQIGTIEKIGFSLKNEESNISETETAETTETKEIDEVKTKVSVNERFARLKKSLRKRSVSIL